MAASRDKIITSDPGALGAEETRQSIPNLAVKLCCGDNTAGGALWEDSSAPGPLQSQAIHPNARTFLSGDSRSGSADGPQRGALVMVYGN